jgi:hypothetical protein
VHGMQMVADMLGRLVGSLLGTRIEPTVAVPDGVVVRAGRLIPMIGGWLSGHTGPAAAVALGRTIVVHPGVVLTERLLRHELAHVRQWRERPLTFPLRYTWQHIRHGYRANPYEVEAREAE